MRPRPKTLLAIVGGGCVLVILVRGLWISGYEPTRSDRYLWGAFHVHSTMSDGLASLDEIARQARAARVGVVMLSEHGVPHREAAVLDETIDGVRFIGGSEVGMPEGHLIVSDVDVVPDYNLPPFPPDAVDDVHEWGGVSVLTYPEDPTHRWLYWHDDFTPDGIEIINVTSYFRASSVWDKLSWAVFSMFNRYYYVSSFESPAYALERWDELLTRGPVWGVYAANAHGGFPITEELIVGIPSYETAFSYVGIGIDREHADDPVGAIRDGLFFAVVRGAGEPERFDFERDSEGTLRVTIVADGLSPRIVLKRDGGVVSETNEPELAYEPSTPGVYRAEVYLRDHALLSEDVPWILSNATFIDVEPQTPTRAELECANIEPLELAAMGIETDAESTASLQVGAAGELSLTYDLSEASTTRVDRWVALALRRRLDLSEFRGVVISGSAPEPMRYWLEIRAGEVGHYATFKLDATTRATTIPWSRFYPTPGQSGERGGIPLADVDAVFIAVNTSSSRTGFSSELTLTRAGWCK